MRRRKTISPEPTATPAASLRVRVQPRASRNEVSGWANGVLNVRLMAPPVEGAANKALIAFLAETLGVKRHQVTQTAGEKSREKTFEVEGLSTEELDRRLRAGSGTTD